MKRRITILSILLVLAVVLSACGGAATTEAPAETTAAPAEPTEEPTEATEAPTEATEAPEETGEVVAGDVVLPRNETMYFNGQQWGSVVCWNPYSSSCNNAMTIAQQDNARVLMFETPYLYNMLDGQIYPLLADGDFAWDEGRTQITFKIKPAAQLE